MSAGALAGSFSDVPLKLSTTACFFLTVLPRDLSVQNQFSIATVARVQKIS